MGLWGRLKKKAKKIGKQVKRTTKQAGGQLKRSTAVALPALLGPGLGDKAALALAKTGGKTARKSTLKGISKVSNVTGRIVQVGATAVATWFGGPILGAAAYRGTALMRQLSQHDIQEAKYKAGITTTRGHNVVWKKQPVRIIEGLAAGLGGAIAGAAAGGTSIFASGSSMVSGILGSGGAAAGGTGAASAGMEASTSAMVAGETAAGTAAAGGGIGTLGYVSAGTGVLGIASKLFGGGKGAGGGGSSEGGIVENYVTGDSGLLGAQGPLGDQGLGLVSEDGSILGTGIPMVYVAIAIIALILWYYFA
jgi:hypothetical protein